MTYFIAIGSIITAWAVLRVFGTEREHRLIVIRQTIESEAAQALQAAADAARAAEEAKNPQARDVEPVVTNR